MYITTYNRLAVIVLLCLTPAYAAAANKVAPWVGETLQGAPCRGSDMNYGPFDYLQRNLLPKQLRIVEKHHFTPAMEQLIAGSSTVPNIRYTLRAWPNHHRALYAMIRAQGLTDRDIGQHKGTPVECFLQRAINFSPNDSSAKMLYGIFLQSKGKHDAALKYYLAAEKIDPNNLQIKYNLGLLLVDRREYTEASRYAQEVYDKGFPMPGLRNKLRSTGHWPEDSRGLKQQE
ncbi:hypothetical protein H2508_06105 [Parahaliea sp. F7430]|uniref:Tetratricopeptide repeat protein n=1 Tax=Sediminihaliea albiluteola TaxID=2758564 RepID=A0A7W2YJV4_9GAMM|nr:hypothetical protein [Sediminihaliea albiluteola]MBA6412683.1 hypothetical protein [Sediminihaliea albiluteola]